MNILGIVFALAAGVFFGIIGPVTKTAYNLGAGVGLAIFLRYIVALLIVAPLIPYQKDLLKTYKENLTNFLLITIASIMLTTGLLNISNLHKCKLNNYYFLHLPYNCFNNINIHYKRKNKKYN